ncbi:MAG: acyl carrier protein [Eubacterium sp.]|nr:acyl carrier protein [Eubacterium sp.]
MTKEMVESTILEVLGTALKRDVSEYTMETVLEEINFQSIQLISFSALLEEKLGDAPNFRALMNMKQLKDVRDYIL